MTTAAMKQRRGFTIIELVVAITILIVGVLGLAGTAAVVMRQVTGGQTQTIAASRAQSRIDSLSSITCTTLLAGNLNGTSTYRGITENWRIVAGNNNTMRITDSVIYTMRTGSGTVRVEKDTIVLTSFRTCP